MFLSKKHLPRRTVLRGLASAISLPLLDAMIPAATAWAQTAANTKPKLSCIYIPHGATMDLWTPKTVGKDFAFSQILKPLEPYRQSLTVISNLGHKNVAPWTGEDVGGAENHSRALAVFLTGAHPVKGDFAKVGTSMDQMAAQAIGQDTPLPSIEMAIEPAGLSCDGAFTCAYRNSMAWKNESLGLPMENNPQLLFERLFGDGTTDAQRRERRAQSVSLLDSLQSQVSQLQRGISAADRARLDDYLQEVREIERRVQRVAATLTDDRALPDAPSGIPANFETHLDLMFDLQVLAFKTGITRIATLMMAREGSNVRYPGSGVSEGFHNASHHSNDRKNMEQFALINAYHYTQVARFLKKLQDTPDGDSNLLHNSMVLYGSSLSDANEHNYDPLPVIVAGNAGGKLQGNRHLSFAQHTPMANLLLAMLHKLEVPAEKIGDSTEPLVI
ncbi:MAG TPA: DUF1552 domain-containing protein [Candidatus Acidoferrum sp.]|nr:DUF1552 domain-containing protein [Candidatus Acidoferrum sp.]